MSVRERILAIRLMEKTQIHPEFAKRLGISLAENANNVTRGKE